MKIKKTRYIAVVATSEGTKKIALFDKETGEGTSGEGKAFAVARKVLQNNGFVGLPFNVQKVQIEAEIDIEKAVSAGAIILPWTIVD